MRLIGQYDSPFVRRTAIAMRLLGIDYEHVPWSVFADGDKVAAFNPLRRVPVLVPASGQSIIESYAIIDHLEGVAGRSLWPQSPAERTRAIRVTCLATGAADKGVSLVYERLLHDSPSQLWADRCTLQLSSVLDELEAARDAATTSYLFGEELGHADIAIGCMWRFISEAHRSDFDLSPWQALQAHSARLEALPIFQEISQPFAVTQ